MMQTAKALSWNYEAAWLSGVRFDLIFIFGVMGVALLSGFIVWRDPQLFGPVMFLDLWLLGYHHVIATFPKLAGTAQDRKENRFLIYYLPFIVAGSVALLAFTVGVWSIVTIYFFWQWYHYGRQSHGVSSFYRRKAKTPIKESPLLAQATLWSIPVWGILNRCSQNWDEFLFIPIWTPDVPSLLVTIAAVISIALLAYWGATRFMAWRNGTLPLGQTLYMASHFTAFYVGYILISDINIGWLVANIWHNAQYILFVWLYNTKRFSLPQNQDKSLLCWVSQVQPVRIVMYFVIALLTTTIIYNSIMGSFGLIAGGDMAMLAMLYVIGFQTLNFHHYIVDSIIWKARKKQHQVVMNLNQASNNPSS